MRFIRSWSICRDASTTGDFRLNSRPQYLCPLTSVRLLPTLIHESPLLSPVLFIFSHLCPLGFSLVAPSVTCFCPLLYPPFFLVCTRPLPTSLLFHSWTDRDGKSGKETCFDYWGHQYLQLKCVCTCWSTAALPRGSTSQCQSEFIALHLLGIKTVKNCCLAFREHASSCSKSNILHWFNPDIHTNTLAQKAPKCTYKCSYAVLWHTHVGGQSSSVQPL